MSYPAKPKVDPLLDIAMREAALNLAQIVAEEVRQRFGYRISMAGKQVLKVNIYSEMRNAKEDADAEQG